MGSRKTPNILGPAQLVIIVIVININRIKGLSLRGLGIQEIPTLCLLHLCCIINLERIIFIYLFDRKEGMNGNEECRCEDKYMSIVGSVGT